MNMLWRDWLCQSILCISAVHPCPFFHCLDCLAVSSAVRGCRVNCNLALYNRASLQCWILLLWSVSNGMHCARLSNPTACHGCKRDRLTTFQRHSSRRVQPPCSALRAVL